MADNILRLNLEIERNEAARNTAAAGNVNVKSGYLIVNY